MTWRIEANRPSKHCSKMDVECMFLNSGGGSWSPAAEEACFWALCLMTSEELRRESALRDKPSLAYNPPRSCSAAARPKFEAAFSPRLSLAITTSSRFTAPSWSCWSTSSSTRADHPCNNASDPSSAIATHLPSLSLPSLCPPSRPTLWMKRRFLWMISVPQPKIHCYFIFSSTQKIIYWQNLLRL